MFYNYLESSLSAAYDRKTCQSSKISQCHKDTQEVGSSALQEVLAGFQQRYLCMVVTFGDWIKKKKKQTGETATSKQPY